MERTFVRAPVNHGRPGVQLALFDASIVKPISPEQAHAKVLLKRAVSLKNYVNKKIAEKGWVQRERWAHALNESAAKHAIGTEWDGREELVTALQKLADFLKSGDFVGFADYFEKAAISLKPKAARQLKADAGVNPHIIRGQIEYVMCEIR